MRTNSMFMFSIFGVFTVLAMIVSASGVFAASDAVSRVIGLSLVNQNPDPAVAGDVVELRISVENSGSLPVEDYVLEIEPSYPFEAISGEEYSQDIGTLNSYQSGSDVKILKYKLKVDESATAGTYYLNVKYYPKGYEDSDSVKKTISIDIENSNNAEIIQIDKTVLVPGKETGLKFVIRNVGSSPLRDVTFSWVNSDKIILPVGSDNTKYVQYIAVGDSAEVDYNVIADSNADAGLYELSLSMTYTDSISDTTKDVETIAGIYVGGGTDFEVAYSESSGTEKSFTVANIGSNPAYSVSVSVPSQTGWSTSGANSMIIGNLNTGDYTVVSFTLHQSQGGMQGMTGRPDIQRNATADAGSSGQTGSAVQTGSVSQTGSGSSGALKLQIAYTDTRGERLTVDKEVMMASLISGNSTGSIASPYGAVPGMYGGFPGRNRQSFFSQYKWYMLSFAVIVLLILLGISYGKYKRGKIMNPNFKFVDVFKSKPLVAVKKK